MNIYRGGLCELCEATAVTRCLRCRCDVCTDHGPAQMAFCVLCAKEYRDDLDVKKFKAAAMVPEDDQTSPFRSGVQEQLFTWFAKAVMGLFQSKPKEQEKDFAQRSLEEIAEWRRSAGIRTRTRP